MTYLGSPLKVDHVGHERVSDVHIQSHSNFVRVIPVVGETEAVVDEQEFVRAVAITVEGLISGLKGSSVVVGKAEVGLVVVLHAIVPIELLLGLFTTASRAVWVFWLVFFYQTARSVLLVLVNVDPLVVGKARNRDVFPLELYVLRSSVFSDFLAFNLLLSSLSVNLSELFLFLLHKQSQAACSHAWKLSCFYLPSC